MPDVTRDEALAAVRAWRTSPDDRTIVAAAVRQSLSWFATHNPGRSVELRVPPYKAVQVIEGATHRRGTPPAIVEMTPQTWLEMINGQLSWTEAQSTGRLNASGERSDLSQIISAALLH